MRDNAAVVLFILIILFILAVYVIAALYFDGLLHFISVIGDVIKMIIDAIMTLLRAIYKTFLA